MKKRVYYLINGVEVKSKLEQTIGNELLDHGITFIYEYESYKWVEKLPRAFCAICGSKTAFVNRSYTPDFFLENGIIIEVKGRFTSKDRKISGAMHEQHPKLDLRMLFDKDNWLNKSHKNRYSDWCKSKDIQYAIKTIPNSWINL